MPAKQAEPSSQLIGDDVRKILSNRFGDSVDASWQISGRASNGRTWKLEISRGEPTLLGTLRTRAGGVGASVDVYATFVNKWGMFAPVTANLAVVVSGGQFHGTRFESPTLLTDGDTVGRVLTGEKEDIRQEKNQPPQLNGSGMREHVTGVLAAFGKVVSDMAGMIEKKADIGHAVHVGNV